MDALPENGSALPARHAYSHSASVGMRLARNAVPMAGLLTSKVEVSEPGKGEKKEPKVLVAFFSWGGTTRGIAGEVRKQSGGDLFEIEPVREYSSDYNTVLNEAQRDQRENARPKLKGRVENFGQYDVILLGYPNWWASVPAPVASFLESTIFRAVRSSRFVVMEEVASDRASRR